MTTKTRSRTTTRRSTSDAAGTPTTRPGAERSGATARAARNSTGARETAGGTTGGVRAAQDATDRHSTVVRLPALGELRLPSTDQIAFLGGLGLLAALGIVEWPLAVAVGVGHALASNHNDRVIHEFGQALEEA